MLGRRENVMLQQAVEKDSVVLLMIRADPAVAET